MDRARPPKYDAKLVWYLVSGSSRVHAVLRVAAVALLLVILSVSAIVFSILIAIEGATLRTRRISESSSFSSSSHS